MNNCRQAFIRALAVALMATAATSKAASVLPRAAGNRPMASTLRPEVILHAFNCCNGVGNEIDPNSDLVRDSNGILYGTNSGGGGYPQHSGSVFKFIPPAAGKKFWLGETLYSFSVNTPEGDTPVGGLVSDQYGDLYGSTSKGGNIVNENGGSGTIFELTPPPPGRTIWKYQVLYRFSGKDGSYPNATLVRDEKSGTLYGTTPLGGSGTGCNGGCGVAFALTPPKAGTTAWSEKTLYNFSAAEGAFPQSGLLLGTAGVLYGAALGGGPRGWGTVFKLTPSANGVSPWNYTVIHAFGNSRFDGAEPVAGLIADARGALYGTTSYGGSPVCLTGCGTVFKLTPPAAGKSDWTQTLLYRPGVANDGIGFRLSARLTVGAGGVLYSTALYGGTTGYGTVFSLTPPTAGTTSWTPTLLHTFTPANGDGGYPGSVISDPAGNLYGTTNVGGGSGGAGVIYELLK